MAMPKRSKNRKREMRNASARPRARTTRQKKQKALRVRKYSANLEAGLQHMREGISLAEAARKTGATPSQLRRYAAGSGLVTRKDGKWHFKRDRRFRKMPIYSDGRHVVITVHNGTTASLIGSYMRAVRMFFETEDLSQLDSFRDKSVRDVNGKRYVFETRPNVLFRLDAAGIEPFDLHYQIVKRE